MSRAEDRRTPPNHGGPILPRILGIAALACVVPAAHTDEPAAQAAPTTEAAPATELPAARTWGASRTLTLDQAFSLAMEGNPDLAAAEARLLQAKVIRRRVIAGLQPWVSAGASYTRNSTEATLSFGPLITSYTDYQLYANGLAPVPLPTECADPNDEACAGLVSLNEFLSEEIVIQPEDAVSWYAQAQWQIGNARAYSGLRLAGATIDAAEEGTAWAQRELLYGVAQAYYGVYTLQQVVALNDHVLASRQRHLELARARLAAGQISATEVLRAEVEVMQAERQKRETEQALHTTAAELAVLLGQTGFEVRVERPATPKVAAAPAAERAEAALEQRRDVKSGQAQLEAARAALLDARLSVLPSFALNATYRYSNAAGFAGDNYVWAAGATANLAVWQGGMKLADMAEARARLTQAEEAQRKLEMGVRKEVEVADSNLEQARVNLQTTEEELKLARRTYDQMVALFEAGRATSLELRDVELLVTNAELSRLRAELSMDLAMLALQRASGEFDPRAGG